MPVDVALALLRIRSVPARVELAAVAGLAGKRLQRLEVGFVYPFNDKGEVPGSADPEKKGGDKLEFGISMDRTGA